MKKLPKPTLKKTSSIAKALNNNMSKSLTRKGVRNFIKINEQQMEMSLDVLNDFTKQYHDLEFKSNKVFYKGDEIISDLKLKFLPDCIKVASVPKYEGGDEMGSYRLFVNALGDFSARHDLNNPVDFKGKSIVNVNETTGAASAGGYASPFAFGDSSDKMRKQNENFDSVKVTDKDYFEGGDEYPDMEKLYNEHNKKVEEYLKKLSPTKEDGIDMSDMGFKKEKDGTMEMKEMLDKKLSKENENNFKKDISKNKSVEKMVDGESKTMEYDYDKDSIKRNDVKQRVNSGEQNDEMALKRGYGMEDIDYGLKPSDEFTKRWMDSLDPKFKELIKAKHKERNNKPKVDRPYVNLGVGVNNLSEQKNVITGSYNDKYGKTKRTIKSFSMKDVEIVETLSEGFNVINTEGFANIEQFDYINESFNFYTDGDRVIAIERNKEQKIIKETEERNRVNKENNEEKINEQFNRMLKLSLYERKKI